MSSSKVCSSWTASVAEGDFRRIENLDFRLFLQKNKTKQKKKTKQKRDKEKEKKRSIAIILWNNYLFKNSRSIM